MDAHRQGGGVEKEIIFQSWLQLRFVGKMRSKCSVRVYSWFLICRIRAGL
jgi:hypothetical protein